MVLTENIVYHPSKGHFQKALKQAIKYAVLSLPWTLNRMSYNDNKTGLKKRLRNIILGKIPEHLIWNVFEEYNIRIESWSGETAFWEKDRFDILVYINGTNEEWDIKNLTFDFSKMNRDDWLHLPALIPNRHYKDQWATRNRTHLKESARKRYLFTFLEDPCLQIELSTDQEKAFADIEQNKKYYIHQDTIILKKIGYIAFKLTNPEPRFVIAATASENEWDLFLPIAKGTILNKGLIKTRIDNMGSEMQYLPSFLTTIEKEKIL